jgi:hypothetical protein
MLSPAEYFVLHLRMTSVLNYNYITYNVEHAFITDKKRTKTDEDRQTETDRETETD